MSGTEIFKKGGELMFGQVREDALVDMFLVSKLTSPSRLFVIASGGCTALSLLSAGNFRIDALDISRAQIALVETKVAIFKQLGSEAAVRACCGDATDAVYAVRESLSPQSQEIVQKFVLENGLNNSGSVDRRMKRLTSLFYAFIHSRALTRQFLSLADPQVQQKFYASNWENMPWRLAMKIVFSRVFLSLSHDKSARSLVPHDFPKVMEKRLARALTEYPNAYNPYLWQAFMARYNDCQECLPPYLQTANHQAISANLDNLHLECADSLDWFSRQSDASFDYLGLSNVLELLPEEYAAKLQAEVIRCARPGAIVCVRAIFPRSKPTFAGAAAFTPDHDLSRQCEKMDRSLFCNFFEIYRRL